MGQHSRHSCPSFISLFRTGNDRSSRAPRVLVIGEITERWNSICCTIHLVIFGRILLVHSPVFAFRIMSFRCAILTIISSFLMSFNGIECDSYIFLGTVNPLGSTRQHGRCSVRICSIAPCYSKDRPFTGIVERLVSTISHRRFENDTKVSFVTCDDL